MLARKPWLCSGISSSLPVSKIVHGNAVRIATSVHTEGPQQYFRSQIRSGEGGRPHTRHSIRSDLPQHTGTQLTDFDSLKNDSFGQTELVYFSKNFALFLEFDIWTKLWQIANTIWLWLGDGLSGNGDNLLTRGEGAPNCIIFQFPSLNNSQLKQNLQFFGVLEWCAQSKDEFIFFWNHIFLKKQVWLWQTDSVSSVQVSIVFDIMTSWPPIILSGPIITLSKTPAKAPAHLVVSNFESEELGWGWGKNCG